MKIKFKDGVPFESIRIGSWFEHSGEIYLKTSETTAFNNVKNQECIQVGDLRVIQLSAMTPCFMAFEHVSIGTCFTLENSLYLKVNDTKAFDLLLKQPQFLHPTVRVFTVDCEIDLRRV